MPFRGTLVSRRKLGFTDTQRPARGGVKALQGRDGYRLRIGRSRVIFDEDATTVLAVERMGGLACCVQMPIDRPNQG
jgi:mRNA interferase RelE/StbE